MKFEIRRNKDTGGLIVMDIEQDKYRLCISIDKALLILEEFYYEDINGEIEL